ncbi:hypothetical protein HMPREF9999_00512 [Alloprevotella sp. oral taxon 473 str. F0040]|nr:hypothetical protein HMPREF9999_00512 [Alloprevotella sp. oral taxon 473 str. F0040]
MFFKKLALASASLLCNFEAYPRKLVAFFSIIMNILMIYSGDYPEKHPLFVLLARWKLRTTTLHLILFAKISGHFHYKVTQF